MTINPPLNPADPDFNSFADKIAATLSKAFGHTLSDAESYVRAFYEFRQSRDFGGWSAEDYFFHESFAIVLEIEWYRVIGEAWDIDYLDWRKICWDPLSAGARVPPPRRKCE